MLTDESEREVVEYYLSNEKSFREIAREFNIDHHRVVRILLKHGVRLERAKDGKIKNKKNVWPSQEEEKKIISFYLGTKSVEKVVKEFHHSRKFIYQILSRNSIKLYKKEKKEKKHIPPELKRARYIASRIRYDVDENFYLQFNDLDKVIFLNRTIRNERFRHTEITTQWYIDYINKFYYDPQFNRIYDAWKKSGDWLLRPSIEHIKPISKGGTDDLINLRFLTVVENRAKMDILQEKWDYIKTHLDEFFIE